MQKTLEKRVQSLGQGDPLDEGMAAHSSVLTWKIPWSRAWQPTPVGLPGRSLGRGHGSPLQCSYLEDPLDESTAALENPMDRGAWHATVLGVSKSQKQLK